MYYAGSMYTLNHVCDVLDRSQACLQESGIDDYCLFAASQDQFLLSVTFRFVCHQQPRDETLLHSLQCVHDNRLMSMLHFHIGQKCGMDILDATMQGRKNAYFYLNDVYPVLQQSGISELYCLPKAALSSCVRPIVEEGCSASSASLVQAYITHVQDWIGQVLESVGLKADICDSRNLGDSSPARDLFRNVQPRDSEDVTEFGRNSESENVDSALDSAYGRNLLAEVQKMNDGELCSSSSATYRAYTACVMSADDKTQQSSFNVLQFAHQILPVPYHGAQCGQLGHFSECWERLQQVCGPRVRGLEQHATLLLEGCQIQTLMHRSECNWQEMLMPHYIKASDVTRWPLTMQGLKNPIFMDHGVVHEDLAMAMDTVISLLQPGVEEISRRCGTEPAGRLQSVLGQLRYIQHDAMKYYLSLGDNEAPATGQELRKEESAIENKHGIQGDFA